MPLLERHLQAIVERPSLLAYMQTPVLRCGAKKYVFSHKATLLTKGGAVKTVTRPIGGVPPPAEGDWDLDPQEAGDDE